MNNRNLLIPIQRKHTQSTLLVKSSQHELQEKKKRETIDIALSDLHDEFT